MYIYILVYIDMLYYVSSDQMNVNKLSGLCVRYKCCFSIPFLQVRQ